MKTEKAPYPVYISRLLAWLCPDHLYEEIEGDLIQKFKKDSSAYGPARAKRRLLWNTLCFFRPGVILRNRRITARRMQHFACFSRSMTFNGASNLTGWLIFSIALVTYPAYRGGNGKPVGLQ